MAESSIYTDVTLPLAIILIPLHLPILIFFFMHRGSQVFKSGCSLELTYLLILGFWSVSSWKLAASIEPRIPCGVNSVIASVLYFVVIVVYMQRALLVLFRFEIQAALDAFRHLPRAEQTIKALESGEGGWYFRHRNLVRRKQSLGYFTLATAIFTILNVGIAVTEDLKCDAFNSLDYVNWVFDICVIPFAIVVACKMRRHANDAFNIKRDLGWAGIAAILITLLSIGGHSAISNPTTDDTNFMNAMVATFTMLWLVILSGYKQMYLLHIIDRDSEVKDYTSLENLLALESGYESYLKYLKTEFSGENLLFWQAVEEFRKKHLQTQQFESAFLDCEQIVLNYVRPGSPMELNIGTDLRDHLMKAYHEFKALYVANLAKKKNNSPKMSTNKINPSETEEPAGENSEASIVTVFDHVQSIVFDLMRKDPFRRYLSSPLYAQFKAAEEAKRETSGTGTGLKVVVDTVKKILTKSPAADESEASHSVDRESQANTPGGSTAETPTGSSYASPFGGGDDHKRSNSYVSPFTNVGGGGLTPRSDSYVSPFTFGATPTATPRPGAYTSPFGGGTDSATTPRSDNYASPFGGAAETTTPPANYVSPFGGGVELTSAPAPRPDNYASPFEGGAQASTPTTAASPVGAGEEPASTPVPRPDNYASPFGGTEPKPLPRAASYVSPF